MSSSAATSCSHASLSTAERVDSTAAATPDLRPMAIRSADAGERRISLRAFYDFDKLRTTLGMERAAEIVFHERASSILDAIAIEKVSV